MLFALEPLTAPLGAILLAHAWAIPELYAKRGANVLRRRPRAGAGAEEAVAAFREQLDAGYYAVVSTGEGHAEQVRELPLDAELVILRRPIAGG